MLETCQPPLPSVRGNRWMQTATRLAGLALLTIGCAAALAAAPVITGVYNAGSWLPPSLPNSGVAQGAIFTVTGTGLGPSALQQVQSYPHGGRGSSPGLDQINFVVRAGVSGGESAESDLLGISEPGRRTAQPLAGWRR